MHSMKRALALLLALVMLFTLSGCGGLEARLIRASHKLSKLQSLRMDMQLDSSMGMSLFGQESSLDLDMTGRGELMLKPLKLYMQTETEAFGQGQKMLSYLEENESSYELYLSADGESWEHSTLDALGRSAQTQPVEQLKAMLELAKGFEESGRESVRGETATVYSGSIAGEYVRLLLENTGLLSSLEEALEVDPSQLSLEDMGSVPVTLALGDKSGLPLKCTMDLTAVLRCIMDVVMKELLARYGIEDLNLEAWGVSVSVEKALLTVEFYDFDQVREISIPAAVLNAA